jgi:hypothetical protein
LVPIIVMDIPVAPLTGVKEVIVGGGINVKPAIDAVPPGVVTLTLPDAPVPTTAVMLVAELTVNEEAVTPPKFTTVTPTKKWVPVIVIGVPVPPLAGVNEFIVGGGKNEKPAIVAVPPGVVTLILPDAPVPTTAVILVAELIVNDEAAIPPKFTAVVPVKLVPVIVIVIPVAPLDGPNEVIVGGGINVNPVIDTVPPGVVTLTLPDAPVPTTAVILVAELTVNDEAATPPKLIEVAPVKFVPVIIIDALAAPLVGVNDVIVGGRINVNPAKVAVPPGFVTLTFPDAPVPTTAVIVVVSTTIKEDAAVPPKLTAVMLVKFVPLMVIVAPVPALVGLKEIITGGRIKINPALFAVPPEVVTLTEPEEPNPTTAVIVVAFTTVNDAAGVPPKLTTVAPAKFVPVIVIVAPAAPDVGVNEEIVGVPGPPERASAPISTGVNVLLISLSKSVVSVFAPVPAASIGDPGFT